MPAILKIELKSINHPVTDTWGTKRRLRDFRYLIGQPHYYYFRQVGLRPSNGDGLQQLVLVVQYLRR